VQYQSKYQILNRAAYVVLGVNLEGNKDIIGIWIGENESSKFWLGVLNELKNRGVEDVLMFCVDFAFLLYHFSVINIFY
jgi:putative transposase